MSKTVKLPDNREVNLDQIHGPDELRNYLHNLIRKVNSDSSSSFNLRIFAPKTALPNFSYAQYENGKQLSLFILEVNSRTKKINIEHYDLIMTRGMTPEMLKVFEEFRNNISIEIHDVSLQERKKSFLTQFAVEREPVHGDIAEAIIRVEEDRKNRDYQQDKKVNITHS